MNEDEQPIEGAEDEQPAEDEQAEKSSKGSKDSKGSEKVSTDNREKQAEEASPKEVQSMYDDLGIKAKAPSDKPKKRPKTSKTRDKDVSEADSKDSKDGQQKDDDSVRKSKDAPADGEDGDSGDDSDEKGKEVGKDSGEVSDESKETDKGVRDAKSKTKEDSKSGSEGDSEQGAERTGEAEDESGDSEKDNEKVKRPGKSNPEIEKRFQKLSGDVRERDEVIAELQEKLQETTQKQAQERIANEDPEYTVDDFRKVRDNNTGEITDLDPESAELAWRRWKDGYEQRSEERQARANYEASRAQQAEANTRKLMEDSSNAYDALASLQNDYPELVETSDKYDPEFAADAMPIIEESIQYLEGTEPGNTEGNLPVITGLKINPAKILKAMKDISNKKRNLPLNGVNDNVESRSNVNVPHSRSSDANVNAANDLYKELGIKKRI